MNTRFRTRSRPWPGTIIKLGIGLLMVASAWMTMQSVAQAGQCPSIFQQRFNHLQYGQPVDLCQFASKVVLVVNTASHFGNQEPDSDTKIAKFCRLTYGVQFPMFEKSSVIGAGSNPIYAELFQRTGQQPGWNFHKYLIDRNGERVLNFEVSVQPNDKLLMQELTRMLSTRPAPSSAQNAQGGT